MNVNVISITIDFGSGGLLIDHVRQAIIIAKQYNCSVSYEMNEKYVTVFSDDDPNEICHKYFNNER